MQTPPPTALRHITGHALPVFVADTPHAIAQHLAREMVEVVRAASGAPVLGFATGRTPLDLYREFARLVRAERVDLSRLECFHLDEYLDLPRAHPASFRAQMHKTLLGAIGVPESRAHFPVECDQVTDLEASCASYEARIDSAGGVDWQLLGIGLNGHVAFNEPGAAADSRTRVVRLSESTRLANRSAFDSAESVPQRAATMGIATIRRARRLRIVALGASKSAIVHELLHARVGPQIPATFLRDHPGAELWCDAAAAAEV